MRRVFFIIFLIYYSAFEISCSSYDSENSETVLEGYLRVKKVVDGDTFWVDDGSLKGVKIRLIGVNAPESRKTFRKEVGYFGREAKYAFKQVRIG